MAETLKGDVLQFDVSKDDSLRPAGTLITGLASPDSMCVDAQGNVYVGVTSGLQVVAALAGASVGVAGLRGNQVNALAFGVLVPMFGIGKNGLWAARYGSYGPRVAPAPKQPKRRIE